VKLVVDTNTLISGALWAGPSSQLLAAVVQGKATLILTPELLAEFSGVISRPRFAARVAAGLTTPEDLALKLAKEAAMIPPADLPLPPELRDPKDLPVLACAVAGPADLIVSGDQDLLTLKSFQGIPIVNARAALNLLGLVPE
jgi:putative PIN family toxin of toxin-antitoxin system